MVGWVDLCMSCCKLHKSMKAISTVYTRVFAETPTRYSRLARVPARLICCLWTCIARTLSTCETKRSPKEPGQMLQRTPTEKIRLDNTLSHLRNTSHHSLYSSKVDSPLIEFSPPLPPARPLVQRQSRSVDGLFLCSEVCSSLLVCAADVLRVGGDCLLGSGGCFGVLHQRIGEKSICQVCIAY